MSDDRLKQFAELSYLQPVKPNDVIFGEGEEPPGFFVVADGEVQASLSDGIGSTRPPVAEWTMSAGQYFGEVGLMLQDAPQLSTYKAGPERCALPPRALRMHRSRRAPAARTPRRCDGVTRELGSRESWGRERAGVTRELGSRESWGHERVGVTRELGSRESWGHERAGVTRELGSRESWRQKHAPAGWRRECSMPAGAERAPCLRAAAGVRYSRYRSVTCVTYVIGVRYWRYRSRLSCASLGATQA